MPEPKFLSATEVASVIDHAIIDRTPLSFIRLGDGEGALLGFGEYSNEQDIQYLRHHFGHHVTHSKIKELQDALQKAIATADLIGVRDDVWYARPGSENMDPHSNSFISEFKEAFPLRPVERSNIHEHAAKRLFQLRSWLKHKAHCSQIQYCSSWVQIDLQLNGFWHRKICQLAEIGLINGSPSLPERLSVRYGVKVHPIQVPLAAIERNACRTPAQDKLNHSTLYNEIADSIPLNLNGRVYFVAAGLIGKQYCRRIKENGGIALDIGALTDTWDGRATRQLVYHDKCPLTASRFEPPPELQLGFNITRSPLACGKKIIFHMGFSKTGTTHIQENLRENEKQLEHAGVHYIQAGRGGDRHLNHHQLATIFGNGARPYDQPATPPNIDAAKNLLKAIDDEIASSKADTFVLSTELLSNFSPHRATEDLFASWAWRHDATLLFYVRNQFDWLISWYMQAAKNGNMGHLLDEFLLDPFKIPNSERFDGNFLRKVKRYGNWVGQDNVIIRNYDDCGADDSLMSDFLRTIGKCIDTNPTKNRANASPSGDQLSLVVARILVRRSALRLPPVPGTSPIETNDSQSLAELIPQNTIDRVLLTGPFADKRLALKTELQARFAEINKALASQYGVHLSPR